jgi:catechol 2,3-dioxygenase-like lactoylglutathione lyase family enzyme
MLGSSHAFSGFSVNDQAVAQKFYSETLGLEVKDTGMGLHLKLAGGGIVFVYPKPNHQAASFTILNFPVEDIDAVVDELTSKGIIFEQYDSPTMPQDEHGILRGLSAKMGPDIAWFKDPAGNILSILQEN